MVTKTNDGTVMQLADAETNFIKADKQLPIELKNKIDKNLLCRYSNKFRFNNALISTNLRFKDSTQPICPDIEYTPYEQVMYNLCNKFNIDISYSIKDNSNKNNRCILDVTYDIEQKNLTCELISGISIVKKLQKICSPKLEFFISENKCKAYYNELIQQKSCKYSYDQYKNLLSLGFMPEVINMAVSNSIYISPDGRYLSTKTSQYDIEKELCFKNISTEGIGDIHTFLNKVITDLPTNLKQEILNSIQY